MKILTLGLDKNICDKNSAVAKRFVSYGNMLQRMDVLVPGEIEDKIYLCENVTVYTFPSSGKLKSLFTFFFKACLFSKKVLSLFNT